MSTDINNVMVTKAYARWAPVYDLVFGPVFEQGRRAAIPLPNAWADAFSRSASAPASRCRLQSLLHARRRRSVEPMLRKAHERVKEHGLTNVEALKVMDAQRLEFPDNSFDVVVAQYVITSVPDPEATLDEFARVLKPGGEIILMSRVGPKPGCGAHSKNGSSRRRASLAGAANSPSSATRAGPRRPTVSGWSSAARCRLSAISRSSASSRPAQALPVTAAATSARWREGPCRGTL